MTTLAEYRKNLVGRTIESVQHLPLAGAVPIGRDRPCLVLTLDNGMMVLVRLDKDLEP